MHFGEKLKQIRIQKGISQNSLAKKMGYVTNSYVADVETGKFVPSPEKMAIWAKLFGLTMTQIEDLKLESKIEELGISDPSFTLMFKEVPNLTTDEKQSIIKAFEAVQTSRAKKRNN